MAVRLRPFASALLIAALWAFPSAAQAPRGDVSGGYQFLNFNPPDGDGESFATGWYADIAGNLTRNLGVVFQVGGNYKTIEANETFDGATYNATADMKFHQFMGGARVTARPNATINPFGQVLAGALRGSASYDERYSGYGFFGSSSSSDSDTKPALQMGGGVDFQLTDRFGVRAGADYMRIFFENSDLNAFRFAVGALFPF